MYNGFMQKCFYNLSIVVQLYLQKFFIYTWSPQLQYSFFYSLILFCMVTGSVVGVKLTFSSLFENKLEISAPESNDQLVRQMFIGVTEQILLSMFSAQCPRKTRDDGKRIICMAVLDLLIILVSNERLSSAVILGQNCYVQNYS